MRIYGVSDVALAGIAFELGFKLKDPRVGGVKVAYVDFTLRMATPSPQTKHERVVEEGRRSFRSKSLHMGRERWAGGAVCWHGHKRFLEKALEINPDLRFKSRLWRFNGIKEFEQNVDATGMVNVGSQAYPVQARECCDCYGG